MAYQQIKADNGKTYLLNLEQVVSVELETISGQSTVNIITTSPDATYRVPASFENALVLMYNITGLTPVAK